MGIPEGVTMEITMIEMNKHVCPGVTPEGHLVFMWVRFAGNKSGLVSAGRPVLSITGVVGPKRNGDAHGPSGQICGTPVEKFHHGWDAVTLEHFYTVWDRWHLNDLKPGTPLQMEYLRQVTPPYNRNREKMSYYDWASGILDAAGLNPDGPDKFGSRWHYEELPAEVVGFLVGLEPSQVPYPWDE